MWAGAAKGRRPSNVSNGQRTEGRGQRGTEQMCIEEYERRAINGFDYLQYNQSIFFFSAGCGHRSCAALLLELAPRNPGHGFLDTHVFLNVFIAKEKQ